jgi:hypothetical protein
MELCGSFRRTHAGKILLFSILAALFALAPATVRAAPIAGVTVGQNQVGLDFPNTATFQISVTGSSAIERIVLEYGVDVLSCGEVVAKAFPEFTPATAVTTDWTWDMRQSGSEPPGARIWWQWRITDTGGNETLTERKEIVWLDSKYAWQSLSKESITLHWYEGGQSFGFDMLDSAVASLARIDQLIEMVPDKKIDLYIYGNYDDLQESILYEPGWTGGMSYGKYNVIILGIPSGEEDWGKGAIAHELMHTVVERNTFSCLVNIPAWLHEGLAMASEGGLGAVGLYELQTAIDDDSIFPLRSLGGGFPEDPDQAALAYDQSFSVVDYLLQQGEPSQMKALLQKLRDGSTTDSALQEVYGFTVNGLEIAWRKSVGAQPLAAEELLPTSSPTFVPTLHPLSVDPAQTAQAPTSAKTPTPGAPAAGDATPVTQTGSSPPWGALIPMACLCLLCLVLLAGLSLFVVIRQTGRKS